MKKAARTLMAAFMVVIGMHATDANAGPFKLRVSSGSGNSSVHENLLASYGSSQSNGAVHGGRGDAQNDPFNVLSNLAVEPNDDGNGPHELTKFESPEGGVTDSLDIPIKNEVTAQAVREPSTIALLLAPLGLLLARRAKR